MRQLFDMDKKNYNPDGKVFSRPSARAIVVKDQKVLLVYSKKYNYYKFPGGGIKKGESNEAALIREVAEETGYQVIPDLIEEFGYVARKQADSYDKDGIFLQENFYYLCEVEDTVRDIKLDDYEKEEGFTAVWEYPVKASQINRESMDKYEDPDMVMRESKVLELVDAKLIKSHDLRCQDRM